MLEVKSFDQKQISEIIKTYYYDLLDLDKVLVFLKQNKLITTKSLTKTQIIKKLSEIIFAKLKLDMEFIVSKDPALTSISALVGAKTIGLIATMFYRIANFFYYSPLSSPQTKLQNQSVNLMEQVKVLTTIDIHPGAQIGEKFFIDHGTGIVIGSTAIIGERCNLFNGVILGSKNVVKPKTGKRHPTLKNNVTICANAKILGDITLGNNVFVSPGAVVLDDIEDNESVLIVNQLQIQKQTTYSYLPSQRMVIYGIVPKFKNSLCILGEGFYNPTVLIKLKNSQKEINYSITYWDKNKIIVKIKNTTPLDKEVVKGAKLIVLSNSSKVILVSNLALEKVLTTLTD